MNHTNYQPYHDAYNRAMRETLPLTMQRIFLWESFAARGFTPDDVGVVVNHLRRKVQEGKKWPSCLLFSALLRNLDEFEEQLHEARAMARSPKPHPARAELAATGRAVIKEQPAARSVADILAGEKAFAEFRALKQSL